MDEGHLCRILSALGSSGEGLVEKLSQDIAPTDLQSLLLEVYRRRAADLDASQILRQYAENRFVGPAAADPRAMLELDRLAFSLASPPFEPVELAPVCPLGTVAVLGDVSQNWVVPTARNTEVVADATNSLALECAERRKRTEEDVRLCASHRVLRTQPFSGPASFAHFRLFGLCTAGRDSGSMVFEADALVEHLRFHIALLTKLRNPGYGIASIRVVITDFEAIHGELLEGHVLAPLAQEFLDVDFGFNPGRQAGRGYYDKVCFEILASGPDGTEHSIVDGGFTDWTAKLLANQKERLLISGIGTERVCALFAKPL